MWKTSRVPNSAPHLSTFLVAVLAGLCGASACSSKDSAADSQARKWELTFDDKGAPVGALLMFGDHEVGRVTEPASFEHDRTRVYVRGTVPADFDGSKDNEKFELELRTPCGTERVPLSTVKEEGRHDPLLHFDPSTAKATGSTLVWSARDSNTKIAIGEAELRIDMDHFVINGLDCAPKHELKIDGQAVGEIDVSGDGLVGLWMPKDDKTCYELTVANFGKDGGSTKTTRFAGGWAYPFPHDRLDYRFMPMPKIIDVAKGQIGATKVAINEVDCAEAQPPS